MTEATHRSRCGICDEMIEEGEDIALYEGEWCHESCVDEAPE